MIFKKALVALGAALSLSTSVLADDCSFSTTIKASASLDQLNSCETLKGKIKITGDEISSVQLNKVKKIDADVNFYNSSSITDINFNNLESISGSLNVQALTQLHSIDFSSLSEAEKLSLISLPSFAIINLNKGISSAGSIQVSDTALSSLQGLTNFDSIETLNINNNKNISSIELDQLDHVKTGLTLSFNGDDCEVKLDNLKWASNLTIQDVADVSVGNLTEVNGTCVIAYNSFENLEISKLKEVGGSLQIFANDELTEVSFNQLKDIGGEFRIYNNSELTDIGFPKLEEIKGAVNIKGKFDNFTLKGLKEVDGDFTVVSTSEDFSCDDFKKLHKKKKIEGHNFKCSAPSKKSKSSKGGSSSSGSSDSDDSSSSGGSSGGDSSSSKSSDATSLFSTSFLGLTILGGALAIFI